MLTAAGSVSLGLMWGWLAGLVSRTSHRAQAVTVALLTTALWMFAAAGLAGAGAASWVFMGVVAGFLAHQCWLGWLRLRC